MNQIKFFALLLLFAGLTSCKSAQLKNATVPENGLIKVAIFYPNEDGKTFDMGYYQKTHMPMMAGFLGKNLKFYEIDKGISGRTPTDKMPFVAIGYFYCHDLAEYNKAVGQNIDAIRADIKKYTNIQPVIQISEVKQWRPSN